MPEESRPSHPTTKPGIRYVDTHCHLDDASFDQDIGDVVARAADLGVDRMIVVGFAPDRWLGSIALAGRYRGLSCMLGFHPGHAQEWSPARHDDLVSLIPSANPVAIGEIGLDFYRGETNLIQQRMAFEAQLALAHRLDLPAVIHMRDAIPEMLDVLGSVSPLPTLVFHSYDGTRVLTDWIIDHGAFVGVGGLATRGKSSDLRSELKVIPLDRMVLETDSPYLVPNGFRHRRNTPESIPAIAAVLADLKGISIECVAAATTSNAERLFPGIRSNPPGERDAA